MSPKPRRIVLWAGLLILAFCLIHAFWGRPLHKGKPLGEWVDLACAGYDNNDAWGARRELRAIGPSAVPLLAKRLRPWAGWRNAYRSVRTYLPASVQELVPDVLSVRAIDEQRYGAARSLALFGPEAKAAVGELVRVLPRANYPVRGVVIAALTAIGPDARRALPALHALLVQTNLDVSLQVEIAAALWEIGRETNTVLAVCTRAMASGAEPGAVNAGYLLSRLFTAAVPAVPVALKVLQDTNYSNEARENAAQVLGAARVSTPEIQAALLHGTDFDQDINLRSSCAMALWRLDSQYAPLATELVLKDMIYLRNRFPANPQDFGKWLEARDLDIRQSIPTLKQLLGSESSVLSQEAGELLRRFQVKTQNNASRK